jgi:threonine dehydratase
LSLGALLKDKKDFMGKKVGIVVSGGNVDTEVYVRVISQMVKAYKI